MSEYMFLNDTACNLASLNLMAFADAAMYQAKESGRNAFVLFADWMNDSAEQQFRLLADLRRAIGSDQLFLNFQPKIRVATQKVAGAEALIRWRHPEHGLIPPDRFIRLAERSVRLAEARQLILKALEYAAGVFGAGTVSTELALDRSHPPPLLEKITALSKQGIVPLIKIPELGLHLPDELQEMRRVAGHLHQTAQQEKLNLKWLYPAGSYLWSQDEIGRASCRERV